MDRIMIGTFKCHTKESSKYSLFYEGWEYSFEQTWFNSHKPTDKMFERQSSLSFSTVAELFIRRANMALDTTKSFNHDVTEEQKKNILEAIKDVKTYAEAIRVELNP